MKLISQSLFENLRKHGCGNLVVVTDGNGNSYYIQCDEKDPSKNAVNYTGFLAKNFIHLENANVRYYWNENENNDETDNN